MYLVLEYMKMGDLINVLKSRGADANTNTTSGADAAEGTFTPLTDMEVWNIFRQVVSGIRYLHYQNVVHGDIKPQVPTLRFFCLLRRVFNLPISCLFLRIYCWAKMDW